MVFVLISKQKVIVYPNILHVTKIKFISLKVFHNIDNVFED